MKILSIYWGICSSASIFIDGKVIAATHEERFSRIKNDDAFPQMAIDYCLKEAGIEAEDLDGAAHYQLTRPSKWSIEDYINEQKNNFGISEIIHSVSRVIFTKEYRK